jgi:hypothetical protein
MKKQSIKFTPEQRAEIRKFKKEIHEEAKKKVAAASKKINELATSLQAGKITKEKFFKELSKI